MSDKTNVAEKPAPAKPGSVDCCVCLTEIPESVAMSSEADEYTQYFCGIECYTQWKDGNKKAKTGS